MPRQIIESKQAAKVLAAIAESNGRLLDLANEMRSRPEVNKVSHDFECQRNYSHSEFGTGPPYIFDWYVDIELGDGRSVWWVIDVFWDEAKWVIKCRIEVPGEYGPKTLKEFPERNAETIDQFVTQLQAATSELVDSAHTFTPDLVSD
jgi:hypothetical protein